MDTVLWNMFWKLSVSTTQNIDVTDTMQMVNACAKMAKTEDGH